MNTPEHWEVCYHIDPALPFTKLVELIQQDAYQQGVNDTMKKVSELCKEATERLVNINIKEIGLNI